MLYFGAKRPHELKRPVLSDQLETMRAWIPSLKTSNVASLKLLGEKIEAAVKMADAAVGELATAKQQNREFRTVGARKQFVDSHNGARKNTYGLLAEMPHKHPDLALPRSFADYFFKRVAALRARVEEKPETAAELGLRIEAMASEIVELRKRQEEVALAEKLAAEQQLQREADDEAEQAAEREVEEALAKLAALRAKRGR